MSEIEKKPIKITETVLRDAHQSLIATRMPTEFISITFPNASTDIAPIPEAPVGVHPARLRIDGIESPIIDLSAPPPAVPRFLDQTVEFT